MIRQIVSRYENVVSESVIGYDSTISSTKAVFNLLYPQLAEESREMFIMLSLNAQYKIQGYEVISMGTLTSSLVHPREVFGSAIRLGSAAIVVAHNHPSGDLNPSQDDISVTNRLKEAGELLGIPMLDHLIISYKGYSNSQSVWHENYCTPD